MAPITLPPSFYNSFWSADYRHGLQKLFHNLEQGCLENEDITSFVESQVRAHQSLANGLLHPPPSVSSPDSVTSLSHSLLSLKGASVGRGEAHLGLAQELEERVLLAWKGWVERHGVRIKEAKGDMLGKGGIIAAWEKDVQKLETLKKAYLTKSRAADDSEDDAKFAPAPANNAMSPPLDNYTSSPKTTPSKLTGANLRRAGTVADRISEKLRAASVSSGSSVAPSSPSRHRNTYSVDGKVLPPPPSPLKTEDLTSSGGPESPSSPREERFTPPVHPVGKPAASVVDNHVSHDDSILLSGLSLTQQGLKDILKQLDLYLLTHPAPNAESPLIPSTKSNAALASRQRSTILGVYEKTFSGAEVVEWLTNTVEGFGGEWDRCEDAATELHKMGFFSRIGVGRGFDAGDDTYFILKINGPETTSQLPLGINSPLSPAAATNAIPSLFKQYQSYLPASLANSDEPVHVRLRREATKADEAYREGVWSAEDKRLEMEERIERGLRIWERWERERLAAVKQVLKEYEHTLAKLPSRLANIQQSTALSVEAFNPDTDLKALIEGNRTGPFRPQAYVYESLESDLPDVNFGIDLRRWSGERGWKSLVRTRTKRSKGAIPEVLEAMLRALNEMYEDLSEEERRRGWIYEVPLTETHMLRNAINNPQIAIDDIVSIVKKFNVPVAAGTVKLFLLELNPPVMGWEGWEDAKAVYPAIGADQEVDMTSGVSSVLGRLPASHVYALNAVIKHLRDLVDKTKSNEPNEVYVTKLALSVGRTILRPQHESHLTIGDRTPSLFLADLINHYRTLFPPLLHKLKTESAERTMPVKKRTALVDQRISRSSLGSDQDPGHLMELQRAQMRSVSPAPGARTKDLPPVHIPAVQAGSPFSVPAPPPKAEPSTPTPPPSKPAANSVSALGLGTPIAAKQKQRHAADSDEDEPFVPPSFDKGKAPAAKPLAARRGTHDEEEKPFVPPVVPPAEKAHVRAAAQRASRGSDEDEPFVPLVTTEAPAQRVPVQRDAQGSDEDEPFIPPVPAQAAKSSISSRTPVRPTAQGSDEDEPFIPPTVATQAPTPQRISTHSARSGSRDTSRAASPAPFSAVSGVSKTEDDGVQGGTLKRGPSSDTSRLRGPRAARGPRPAPGSISKGGERPESPAGLTSPIGEGAAGLRKVGTRPLSGAGSRPETPGTPGAGERPTSKYGHSTRNSVSAAIAKFEQK
ncbi:GTPase activating protein [Cryptococcus wingfieldii CBS 7118]|uniref:GTPase activating protein n=1 Tax=Cryptococcus wingfieldii CBS 7118 TaxID=1295528 RepID=A0A1E3JJ16_9TREE|nr:GTPase activating protein [Cryptococcus wingfieldii CBS 7118]ODO00626.1 GTPase activating protein [Cryptococcus wingfieldii CBS 7118]